MIFLYRFLQWTWGIVQTLIGAFLYLIYRDHEHFEYHGSIVTLWERRESVSLGMFIFLDQHAPEHILVHEYGHTIQSLYSGPLYLLIFGIPSFLWCNLHPVQRYRRRNHIYYFTFYPERLANRLGEKYIRRF